MENIIEHLNEIYWNYVNKLNEHSKEHYQIMQPTVRKVRNYYECFSNRAINGCKYYFTFNSRTSLKNIEIKYLGLIKSVVTEEI